MSPNVGNFVSDLVEMAKATEMLPVIQHELEQANRKLAECAKTIQSRELHIIDLKNQIDDLQTKLHAMEVSRDDAEYRFLEADEKLGKIAQSFAGALAALDGTGKLIQKETAKPEPAPNVPETGTTVSETSPELSQLGVGEGQSEPGESSSSILPSSAPSPEQGGTSWAGPASSETLPTPFASSSSSVQSSTAGEGAETSADASSTKPPVGSEEWSKQYNAETDKMAAEAIQADPTKPYAGKKWSDVRIWSKDEWIKGGGSEEGWNQ